MGQASAQVTVTDAASLLETETSSRGQVIGQAQIRELPLNGRAYADLTLLSPGVAKSALENQADSSRDASFNVNGQRSELNNFMLDGVDNNSYGTSNQGFSNQVIQANPDSLAEFKIESNNYSAEFGRASGAVISASIKSGTNQYHGEAWEFLRNTVLNAQGFFKPVGGGKLPFNQNQFGGAFGGPIKKDKLFFFADYEGFRRVSHPVQFATLPTTAMDNGDFSAFGVPIENPVTGTIYPNGIIPQSAFTPLAAVLSALPAPNLPGNSNNYESSPADTVSNNKGDFRADYFAQLAPDVLRPLQPGGDEYFQSGQHSESGQHQQQQRQRVRPEQAGRGRRHVDDQPDFGSGSAPGRRLHDCRQDPSHAGLEHAAVQYPGRADRPFARGRPVLRGT